jgi:5'-nucleotidase
MFVSFVRFTLLASLLVAGQATNIVLTNDDGWAAAIIRAQYDALVAAGNSVCLVNELAGGAERSSSTIRTGCTVCSCGQQIWNRIF